MEGGIAIMSVRDILSNRDAQSKAERVLSSVFLALSTLYVFFFYSTSTTFFLPYPPKFEKILFFVMLVVAAARLPFVGLKRKEVWIGIGLAAIYAAVYLKTDYIFILFLGLLVVGFTGMDYRRVLKVHALVLGAAFAATVLAALIGVITNLMYIKAGLRSSWGICYPTDFATQAFMWTLLAWVAWKKLPNPAMLLIGGASLFLSWCIARSTTSTVCGLLLIAAILYETLERRVLSRRKGLRWISRGVDGLLTAAMPLMALAMFALMFSYAKGIGFGIRVNDLMSDRLRLAVEAWREHGLHPFGTPFEMIGYGFYAIPGPTYNYVDSSYPALLIRYGWVLTIALIACWVWMTRKAIRCGDRRLALVLGIIAVHCFSEQHLVEVKNNLLVVLPCAAFLADSTPVNLREQRRSNLAAAIVAAVVGVLLGLFLPRALTVLRTAAAVKDILGEGLTGWAVLAVLVLLLALSCGVVIGLYRIVRTLLTHDKMNGKAALTAALCTVLLCGFGIWVSRAAGALSPEDAALVKADAGAVEVITKSATGKVYSDVLPEAYVRRYRGISPSVLCGEDLARHRGSTVIADANREYNLFIRSGFLYAQISDAHGVYTDDPSVAAALEAAGYRLAGYFNSPVEVDLAQQALLNNLTYEPDRGVLLDGPLTSISQGPYLDVRSGKYTASYTLRLTEKASREPGNACSLRVYAYYGTRQLAERTVPIEAFDAKGRVTIDVPFELEDSQGVEFLVFADDMRDMYVEHIAFTRTPDIDLRRTVDSHARVTREAYYSLEGVPISLGDGSYAREYGYDRDGNVNTIRICDVNGTPMLNAEGWAERRMVYNRARQIVREEYFGVDGEPITIAAGYAALNRAFNATGNPARTDYFDVNGTPASIGAGYTSAVFHYDENGQLIQTDYLDAEGNMVEAGN